MFWMCADQQWKYDYGPPKCNHLTGIPLISAIEIADLLELPYITLQQYLFLSLGVCFLLLNYKFCRSEFTLIAAFYLERCELEVRM